MPIRWKKLCLKKYFTLFYFVHFSGAYTKPAVRFGYARAGKHEKGKPKIFPNAQIMSKLHTLKNKR